MRGILLAGGSGTRLYPTTKTVSKQLVPVYDKPAIYYPLSTLMFANIREILIISTPRDVPMIQELLADGSKLGLNISYAVQDRPNGIAEAFVIGDKFVNNEPCALILGDNLFFGHQLPEELSRSSQLTKGAEIFAYRVSNPEAYGVVTMDNNAKAQKIVEKPKNPESNWAVTGLYFYDGRVSEIAKALEPSGRGELEITDLNRHYLEMGELTVRTLGRGVAWLDVGTHDSLLDSAQFVRTVEKRQGMKVGCIEEVAYHKGFISRDQLGGLAEAYPNSSYGTYLRNLFDQGIV